jgi:hypothetical protein
VIPVLYLVFDDMKDWAVRRVHRFRAYLRLRSMPSFRLEGGGHLEPQGVSRSVTGNVR